MGNYVLDKAYRITEGEGIAAGIVAAPAEGEETCRVASPEDPAVLGITTYSQPREGRFVAVRRLGIGAVIAAGAIGRGEAVRVANDQGHVSAIPRPIYTTGSVGSGNALVFSFLDRGLFHAGLSITLHDPGEEAPFSWEWDAGGLRLVLESDSGGVTQTAAALITAVEGDALLSRLIDAGNAQGSLGNGIVAPAVLHAENLGELTHPIGVAEGAATQAGDFVNVLLTP